MKQTALITGASSGIGREFAKIHASRGGNLVVVARSGDELLKLKEELEKAHKTSVYVIEKDLTETGAAKAIYDELKSEGITVDILINNAGFGGLGAFHERELEQDLNMIDLNIKALVSLTHYFLQDFIAFNKGRILNVSSTASLMPGPLQATYYATKAFVTSFSNALHEELAETEITVTNLMPGATETKFGKVSGMDKTDLFKNTASAAQVAQEGYEAMLQGKLNVKSGLTTPQKIMMSLIPLTPKKLLLKQIKKMQQVED